MAGSGANTVRLTKINPILGSGRKPTGSSLLKPNYLSGLPDPPAITAGPGSGGFDRTSSDRGSDSGRESRDRKRKDYGSSDGGSGGGDGRSRKRRSRWGGDENDKTFIPGMPTILPTNLNKDQEEAYLIQLQIEDYSRRLRSGDLGIPSNPDQRSPSPEPIYSSDGKRLNTRDYRTRRRLEDDRHKLIQKMFELNPDYKPPLDYKPPTTRVTDKIVIPQEEHPEINFIGLLIGPRGNTLKSLEKESGAKIVIRGKGSVKEGKVGRRDGLPMPGEDEPLHAIISSINPECVKRAVDRIKEIIRQGVEVPEDQNDLRRNQLRELALLNGTLREQEGPRCSNCGATNHKSWQCPDKPNVTNNVICNSCGGAGHIARDCRQRRGGGGGGGSSERGRDGPAGDAVGGDRAKIDEEYMSLMAELGEGPPPRKDDNNRSGTGGSSGYGGGNLSRYSGRTAFDRREPPRPLMGPLT
ncbi:splicing factor 1-like [Pollicipes pollicipes]|nr:splicing factor 1-like [Pollicipes pollicipes]